MATRATPPSRPSASDHGARQADQRRAVVAVAQGLRHQQFGLRLHLGQPRRIGGKRGERGLVEAAGAAQLHHAGGVGEGGAANARRQRGRPVEELLRRRVGRARGDRDKQVEAALLAIEDRPRLVGGAGDGRLFAARASSLAAVGRADRRQRGKADDNARRQCHDRPMPAEKLRGAARIYQAKSHRNSIPAIEARRTHQSIIKVNIGFKSRRRRGAWGRTQK